MLRKLNNEKNVIAKIKIYTEYIQTVIFVDCNCQDSILI